MSVEEILLDAEERMEKALGKLKHDLGGILAHFADDAVFESPRGADPWGTRFVGLEEIRRALFETLKANGMRDGAHVRLTLTRGVKVTSGMSPKWNRSGPCLIVLAVRDWPQVHACFHDQASVLTPFGAVHLGMTTQTSRPVPMVSVGSLVLQEHLERL